MEWVACENRYDWYFDWIQWLIYDSFKVYIGLPTTGGH